MGPSYLGTTASYDRVIGRAPFDTVVGGGWGRGCIQKFFSFACVSAERERSSNIVVNEIEVYILPLFLPPPLRTRLVYSC